jgi:hypothetical protein
MRCDSYEDGDNAMMSVIEEVNEDESLESEEIRRQQLQLQEQTGVRRRRRVSEDSSSRSTVDSSNTGSDTEESSMQGWNV